MFCFLTQPKEGQQQIKKTHKNIQQNCQKIELYGSLTTKKLKKKHSSTAVGGAETGSWDAEDALQGDGWMGKVVAGRAGGPTSNVDKPGGTNVE